MNPTDGHWRSVLALVAAMLALLATPRAWAQPAEVSRIVKRIDFEERRLGNAEDIPMDWSKVTGPKLPHYVNGRLEKGSAHGGDWAFRLDLNGGGLIYRYDPKKLPVKTGAHYRVDVMVKTTVMQFARARLTSYLLDEDRRPIGNTIRHSELYSSGNASDPYHKLTVEVSADTEAAKYLVIEIGLVQPAHYATTLLGERALFDEDIAGSAWFDDLKVSMVPKLSLDTLRAGNILPGDRPSIIRVVINDPFADDLAARLVIRDGNGKQVHQRSGAIDMQMARTIAAGRKQGDVDLPKLPAGYYEASIEMLSRGEFIAAESIRLIQLAPDAVAIKPDARFGLVATDLPFVGWDELPGVLPFMGAGRIKLAVWSKAGDVQKIDPDSFDRILVALQAIGVTPTACLVEPPPGLAGVTTWTDLLRTSPDRWKPQLSFLVARHANHLDRWQLGADHSTEFINNPKMREVYGLVYDEFARLVRNPDLAMPWTAWHGLDGKMPATVSMSIPTEINPSEIHHYVDEIRGKGPANLSLSLRPLDRATYGRDTQTRDLVQRVIYSLAAGAQRIELPFPMTISEREGQLVRSPDEMLLVIRTMTSILAGAEYRGKVPIAEGVEAFLFEAGGKGILVLWDRGEKSESTRLEMNLGPDPMRVDLFGNTTPLTPIGGQRTSGEVELAVGQMPMFILGVDAYMARCGRVLRSTAR